jgi:hypothetical protein
MLACTLLAAASACSSAAPQPAGGGAFPSDPYTTTTSDSGSLVVDVRTSPQPPGRGTNTVQLTVTHASDGSPADGLTVDVAPFMPAMDHGTSDTAVTPAGGGVYLVTGVYLYMPGTWELRTSISGPMTDHAAPQLTVE